MSLSQLITPFYCRQEKQQNTTRIQHLTNDMYDRIILCTVVIWDLWGHGTAELIWELAVSSSKYCGCRHTPQYLAPLRWHDWSVSTDVAGWSLWTTQLETGYSWRCDASLAATGDGSRDRISPGYRRRRSCLQSAPERWLAASCLVVYTVYQWYSSIWNHFSLSFYKVWHQSFKF